MWAFVTLTGVAVRLGCVDSWFTESSTTRSILAAENQMDLGLLRKQHPCRSASGRYEGTCFGRQRGTDHLALASSGHP